MEAQRASSRKIVVAAVFGNLLEFYDFTVYSYFAIAIGKLFFPSHDPVVSLLMAFSAFAIGSISRPLGGFILGRYADIKGRRPALTLTIMLMGLGSAMIGLAPTFEQVGILAPVIIIVARLIQGLAQGGEFGAATATLLENGADNSRAFRASWQLASQGASALLGSSVAAILTYSLSATDLAAWGWRIPFLLGVLIVPVGLYLRTHLKDDISPIKHQHRFEKKYLRNWFLTVFSIMGMTISNYVLFYFMPIYSTKHLGLSPKLSIIVAIASSTIALVMSPIFGMLSDKIKKRKPIAITGRIMLIALLYPAFWAMSTFPSLPVVVSCSIVLTFFYTMASAPGFALFPENFPKHIRAGYMASAYAMAVSIFGGTTQLVAESLLHFSGNKMAPTWYMIAAVLLSLFAVSRLTETGDKPLEE